MYRKPDIGLDGRTQLRFQPASVIAGHIICRQQSTHDRFHFFFSHLRQLRALVLLSEGWA